MRNPRKRKDGINFFYGVIVTIIILTVTITVFATEPDTEENVTEAVEIAEVIPEMTTVHEENEKETEELSLENEIVLETDVVEFENSKLPNAVVAKVEVEVATDEAGERVTEPAYYASKVSMSDGDYDVLLKIVEAEASGQAIEGKMYVADVILNRTESEDFPDTITGVVYERHQFTPASNGRINCTPTESTIEAVNRVLAGERISQGATYFLNPDISPSKNVAWFRSHLTYLFSYGGHEFYK